MKGTIGIEDLKISCIIGCLEDERLMPQELLITIRLTLDFASSDQLSETVDYTKVAKLCEQVAVFSRYTLLETLAMAIALKILDEYLLVDSVAICIKKPLALKEAEYSFVEFEHDRKR